MLNESNCTYKSNSYEDYNAFVSRYFTSFRQQLAASIKGSDYNDLFYLLNKPHSLNLIKQFSYEVLILVLSTYNSECDVRNKKVNIYCEKILYFLSLYCEPSELLVYLLEQIEISNSNQCTHSLLSAMRTSLLRCKNPSLIIDMCINKFKILVPCLPVPVEELVEENIYLQYLISQHLILSNFVDNLYNDFELIVHEKGAQNKIKYILLNLLLSMFGKPMCFIDLDYNYNQLLFQKTLRNILFIQYDVVYFFRFINYGSCLCNRGIMSHEKIMLIDCLPIQENQLFDDIHVLSLCNFYWLVLHKTSNVQLPHVYNPYYIAYNCINLSNYLMWYKEQSRITIIKALDLLYYALSIIKKILIPCEALDLCVHNRIMKALANLIINNDSLRVQKYALKIFVQYIHSFCNKAKYIVIDKLISLNYHSKIISIVIVTLKNIIANIMIKNKEEYIFKNVLFFGKTVEILISKICILHDGINTDLLDNSDRIIAVLNFILFIAIRNKKNNQNMDFLKKIRLNFFKTLERTIEFQKPQWIFKYNDLLCNRSITQRNDSIAQSFLRKLPLMSIEQSIQLCEHAINVLLLFENILLRIYEVMDY